MKIRNIRYWILIADLACILCALVLAIALRYGSDGISLIAYFETYSLMSLVASAVWALLYFEMSLDGFRGGWQFPAILSKLTVAVSLLMVVVFGFAFLTKHYYSRLVLLFFAIAFAGSLVAVRCLFRLLVRSGPNRLGNNRCVILGDGPVAKELTTKIASHPELPFEIVGFLFPGESEPTNGVASSVGTPLPPIKTLQIRELLSQQGIKKLIIATGQSNGTEIRKLISECRKASIQVYLVPQWYDLYVSKAELVEIDGLPLFTLEERNRAEAHILLKRAMDVLLGLGILLLVSPILLAAAFFVYLKKGKAFRSEPRCGKDGTLFQMYRLNVDRDAAHAAPYERYFVRWSLTELPQMWNVLRGDMSLVGPRPEPPERVKYYSDWQRQRLKVGAGVTGLAQVQGLREQHSSEDKAHFDLQYIFSWSPFLDLSLVLQTVWTLFLRGLSHESTVPRRSPDFSPGKNQHLAAEVIDVNRS